MAKAGVPETALKKRTRNEKWAAEKKAAAASALAAKKSKKVEIFKRAEKYVKEYRAQEADEVRLRREAKKQGGFYVAPENKLAFVVRIRGINDMAPQSKKILQLLRLRQINNGVFVRINKATLGLLKRVDPYIAWGYPNLKTVRELVYKRGFGKVNNQRVPLTENSVVEGALGKQGVICVEDVIHQIYTVGPAFKECNNFLWPFQLSNPNGGLTKKRVHYIEGGDAGNREENINALVRRMN